MKICFSIAMVFFFPLTVFAAGSTVGSAFGANIHLRQRIPFSQWNAVMSQAEAAGVQWGREEFEWDVVESTDNTFSFTAYDAVLNAYQEHNIEMLGLLTYSADWASSNPGSPFAEFFMPDEEAWRDYVRTVTSHYAGEVPAWEIWNEPNHASFWRSDIQEYATLVNSASEEIRAVDPDARIVLGGLSGTDTDYLARLLPLLDDHAIDIVAVHPYRHLGDDFNYAPEETEPGLNTLLTDLRRLDAVLERHDFEGNVWLTEVGWSTGDDGVTKKQQAQFLSRLYTIALSQTRIKKVFWYALTDTAVDASIEDAHFGLLTRDDERKKSFRAFRFLAQKMPGYRFRSLLLPGREWLTRFSKKTRWSTSDRQCTRAQVDARTKKKRLRIEYQFTDRTNCYVPVTRSIRMPTKARALSFRARGSSDPTLLRLRVTDRTGETFQYDIGELSASQWLTYVVQLDQHAAHWGGNNNGKLDRPLFFHAFVLDNAPGSLASGVARFDDLSASPIPDTMVMKWSDTQGRPPLRTFWKNGGSRRIVLKLKNATRARVIRIRGRILKQSNKKRYRVKATPFVKLLKRT